jgi:hypothetical protein
MNTGKHGFRKGMSLAKLLAKHRGTRNQGQLPKLTVKQILAWADDHHQRTGAWPKPGSGPIPCTSETWHAIAAAIRRGRRGSSLFQLLAAKRNVGPATKPEITVEQILKWADQLYQATGNWPLSCTGPIPGAAGLTWHSVDHALRSGKVDPKATSLFTLLRRERGIHRHVRRPRITVDQILAWADEHHKRTGSWPDALSGYVAEAPHENWRALNYALMQGSRGLPTTTLAKLLIQGRNIYRKRPPLSKEEIRQ